MTSKSVASGRKTRPTKASNRSAKKRNRKKSEESLLPCWDEVLSDDSLNDFIVDKTPVVSHNPLKRRLLFDEDSSDCDDDERRNFTPVTSRNRNAHRDPPSRSRKPSTTPQKPSANVLDILNFDSSPRKQKNTTDKKNRKSLNTIVDKLVKSKDITVKEKRERFLAQAVNRIKEFDKKILKDFDTESLYTVETSREKKDSSVAKATPANRKSVAAAAAAASCELRRSGRVRKSVSVKRNNGIIAHWHSGFINKVQDQLLPLETIDVDKIKDLHLKATPKKTSSCSSSSSSKKQLNSTAKKEAPRQTRALKVALPDSEEGNSPPAAAAAATKKQKEKEKHDGGDSVNVQTGVLRLKPREQKKMGALVGNEQALYSVWKGRALVVIDGGEGRVVEGVGEFMVKGGEVCVVRNLEERKHLLMHYCKVA